MEIITKLRTERINLNNYLKFIKKHDTPLCRFCGREETVIHFLTECSGITDPTLLAGSPWNVNYDRCRNEMKNRLRRTAIFFNNPIHFNTNNILFPHTWQQQPIRKQHNFKEIIKKNDKRRAEILKIVVRYVMATKRFQDSAV